jgi:hypothetical protein
MNTVSTTRHLRNGAFPKICIFEGSESLAKVCDGNVHHFTAAETEFEAIDAFAVKLRSFLEYRGFKVWSRLLDNHILFRVTRRQGEQEDAEQPVAAPESVVEAAPAFVLPKLLTRSDVAENPRINRYVPSQHERQEPTQALPRLRPSRSRQGPRRRGRPRSRCLASVQEVAPTWENSQLTTGKELP